MICIEGKTAFSGIAIGPIREFAKKSSAVRRSHVDDTAAECTRFEEAKKVAMEELGALYDKAVKESHSLAFCMKKHAKRLARPMQRSSRYIR